MPRTVVAMINGEVAIYFFGLLWLSHFVPPEKVLDFGLYRRGGG
jgi:biotin transporter BioY